MATAHALMPKPDRTEKVKKNGESYREGGPIDVRIKKGASFGFKRYEN